MEEQKNLRQLRMFAKAAMVPQLYHGFLPHIEDMVRTFEMYGVLEGLNREEMYLGKTTVYMHDLVCVFGRKDNEEASVIGGRDFMRLLNYKPYQIDIVSNATLATKMPTNPKTVLERVVCDADVDNLGREDFMEKCEALRQEAGVADKIVWYTGALKFLEGHKFYTESARRLRQEGFEDNKKYLENWLKLNGRS